VVADVHALLPHASAAGRTLCNLCNYDFLLCGQALTAVLAGRERRAAASLALHLLTVQTKLWTACQECDLCPLGATCAGYLQPPYDLSLLAVALSWNVSRRGTADDAWSSQLGPRRLLGRWLGANEPVLPVRPRPEIRLTVLGGHVECIHINADHRCMQPGEAAPHMCSASVPDHFDLWQICSGTPGGSANDAPTGITRSSAHAKVANLIGVRPAPLLCESSIRSFFGTLQAPMLPTSDRSS
jgi:hypothetical protein